MPSITIVVPDDTAQMRVDKFLSGQDEILAACGCANRSHLQNIITNLVINGNSGKFSSKIKSGDKIDVEWEEQIPQDIQPQDLPLNLVYEDDDVTVVNKEQGMVTHPAAGNWTGTLVNALLFHWGRGAVETSHRPGIVHRLDKDTSGLIITAKNIASETWLQEQFQQRRVKKEYIAIVVGRPPAASGNIKTQLIRDPKNRKRFKASTDSTQGKFAHTVYRCIACYGPFSLMRLRLKTGRTHQIRVHMKHIGCPILGDP
ncbi:MAG: RluA family pseudouridine synthase, partial [Spirochaetia bacterium]|nr:RluA family pseudouridine synthase [Spirochaetia bacterium]